MSEIPGQSTEQKQEIQTQSLENFVQKNWEKQESLDVEKNKANEQKEEAKKKVISETWENLDGLAKADVMKKLLDGKEVTQEELERKGIKQHLIELLYEGLALADAPDTGGLALLNESVLLREPMFNGVETDSIDTVVKCRRIIQNDLNSGNQELLTKRYDPRLKNILMAWQKGDSSTLQKQDLTHLANLLSQNVSEGDFYNYDKKGDKLRNGGKLTEKAYQLAYASIAKEVFVMLKSDLQDGSQNQKLVQELMGGIKKPENYLAEIRSESEIRGVDQPLKILAPNNLFKLVATVWGGAVAVINAIASKGDVMNNPWFWTGLGTSYVGSEGLKGKSPWNRKIDDVQIAVDRVEHNKPFRKAEKVNGKEIEGKDLTLEQYMLQNKNEVILLKEALAKNGGTISQLKSVKKDKTNAEGKAEKSLPMMTREQLGLTPLATPETEEVAYRRYLFYEALKETGIKNLKDLNNYEAAVEMFGQDPRTWTGEQFAEYRKIYGTKWLEKFLNLKHGNAILDSNLNFRERLNLYEDLINKSAKNYGLNPDDLKALISVESNGHWSASSGTGSLGMMQLTSWIYWKNKYGGEINPFNPEESIDRGAEFLADLMYKYKGNREKAFTAYNTGEPMVDKAVKRYGSNWKMGLSKEGQGYYGKIQKALNNKKNLWE